MIVVFISRIPDPDLLTISADWQRQASCQAVLQSQIKIMAASSQASRGLGALIKRGWNEIPEIMGSSCIALLGLAIGGYTVYKYQGWDGQYRQYRMSYTVYRPDDPRVAKIRKD